MCLAQCGSSFKVFFLMSMCYEHVGALFSNECVLLTRGCLQKS